jgi:hypothetical protein
MRTTTPRLLAAALAFAPPLVARATVVEATSTTLVTAGQQTRGGLAGQAPDLVTVTPAYELISVSAREIATPGFDDLQIILKGWGSYDFGDVRWDAGTNQKFTGDLTTGYVRGQLLHRAVTIRAGREYVVAGAGGMLQLDGGDILVRLPGGVSVSGFAGVPVAQRFGTRSGLQSYNPAGGDAAYGGRVGFSLPFAGVYGRSLDLGASALVVNDHGDPARQDVSGDLRFSPGHGLVFTGIGTYSVYAGALAELGAAAVWDATRKLFVNLDFKYTRPDLFLSRTSILSVFSDTDRKDLGGGLRYKLSEALSGGVDYHAVIEPGTSLGHEVALKGDWNRDGVEAGGEVSYLSTGSKGYTGLRAYGRKDLRRFFLTGDVSFYAFKEAVNGDKSALTGTVSAGYQIAPAWSAVVAARAGMNPFLSQQADVFVKLVYNQTYRAREVQ